MTVHFIQHAVEEAVPLFSRYRADENGVFHQCMHEVFDILAEFRVGRTEQLNEISCFKQRIR